MSNAYNIGLPVYIEPLEVDSKEIPKNTNGVVEDMKTFTTLVSSCDGFYPYSKHKEMNIDVTEEDGFPTSIDLHPLVKNLPAELKPNYDEVLFVCPIIDRNSRLFLITLTLKSESCYNHLPDYCWEGGKIECHGDKCRRNGLYHDGIYCISCNGELNEMDADTVVYSISPKVHYDGQGLMNFIDYHTYDTETYFTDVDAKHFGLFPVTQKVLEDAKKDTVRQLQLDNIKLDKEIELLHQRKKKNIEMLKIYANSNEQKSNSEHKDQKEQKSQ